ncbi:hypothetical protein AM588_10001385 [Phytophthora nicotianae]|uniref:Nuclear migration protein nudC n=1 Tax=Phytophthora nicotianae TaxID=4792 RepID=A0A0W8CRP0_PHYNI|nr:hypothetical protein AM588_10001385 [Phytophthora nicotianae]
MSETDRFDSMLLTIAQSQRGIEPLLDTVFSFLRRKTDFFTGAEPQVVEDTILKSVRKQAALAEKDQFHKKQQEAEKRRKQEAVKLEKRQKKEEKAKDPPRFEEITDDDAETKESTPEQASPQKTATKADGEEKEDNGPLPEGTKSRQVDVEIRAGKMRVGLRGGETFVDGPLYNKVKVDDSFWTLEDGNRICIYLQKDNQMEWWKTIIQGDPEIDTQKVQPENSKLDDLDSDTRQTVEKMMFDQRQKAMGLPSSDDMQKQEILQKFMAQHPEMDFSKAKIN